MQTVRLMTPEELALHGHAPEGQEPREGSDHLEEIMPCVHMLAIDVYGNYAVQKRVFSYCNNLEIYDTLAAEIIESVNKLSREKFANYVVQYLLEHGGQAKRSMMVSNFAGYVVSMSYNKFASNVIEACLTFGSQEDRQLITNEIITRKMVSVAEEQQVGVLAGGCGQKQRGLSSLMRFKYGEHVIAAIESFLSAKGKTHSLPS
ncbi:hypothetical protein SETIT_8G250900v2 [Setaria italica]|uniref:PUM-HD domain-containing protein n=1 Tax=Setaria italica TaxID=4555 RepID=K3ZM39_SETIT|nr:hypothetical protein SETIT_8G250900v2 [Setaria italica]